MKQFFLLIGVSFTVSTATLAQAKKPAAIKTAGIKPLPGIKLVSQLDSFSYALGMNIANNLKQQNITEVNGIAMTRAMNDIFKGKTTTLNEQQSNSCVQQTLQLNSSKKSGAEKAKGKAFLDANKKRTEVITLPSGLQYEVMKKGDETSAMPKLQDTVVAHYAGTLTDGKEFDNSYKRGEPLTIPVGGVIRGWTEALQLMHIGDKWKVFIPSELGYGDRGAGQDIPGGATLVFEMELLGIKPAAVAAAPTEEKKN
jgi:FKBP-type peptidyl-prolyl cis-trans isomerase FklB